MLCTLLIGSVFKECLELYVYAIHCTFMYSVCACVSLYSTVIYNIKLLMDGFSSFRRNLGYEDVLAALAEQGISIRVASPKLVMEEVCRRDVYVMCTVHVHICANIQGKFVSTGVMEKGEGSGCFSQLSIWCTKECVRDLVSIL